MLLRRSKVHYNEPCHAQETHAVRQPQASCLATWEHCVPAIVLGPACLGGVLLLVAVQAMGRAFTGECSCTGIRHICTVQGVLASLKVSLGTSDTKFSAALGTDKRISVAGTVKGSQSYLTRVGTFDVDLSLQGIILLVSIHHSTLGTGTYGSHTDLICCQSPLSVRLCLWICHALTHIMHFNVYKLLADCCKEQAWASCQS